MRKSVVLGILFSLCFSLSLEACWWNCCCPCHLHKKNRWTDIDRSLPKRYRVGAVRNTRSPHAETDQAIIQRRLECNKYLVKLDDALETKNPEKAGKYLKLANNCLPEIVKLLPRRDDRINFIDDFRRDLARIMEENGCGPCWRYVGYIRRILFGGGISGTVVTFLYNQLITNGFITGTFGPKWTPIVTTAFILLGLLSYVMGDRNESVAIKKTLGIGLKDLDTMVLALNPYLEDGEEEIIRPDENDGYDGHSTTVLGEFIRNDPYVKRGKNLSMEDLDDGDEYTFQEVEQTLYFMEDEKENSYTEFNQPLYLRRRKMRRRDLEEDSETEIKIESPKEKMEDEKENLD